MTPKIITRYEHLVELRNGVARRKIQEEANAIYWDIVYKKAKPDSQERVDALNNAGGQRAEAKKDKIFLECIDQMIKDEENASND